MRSVSITASTGTGAIIAATVGLSGDPSATWVTLRCKWCSAMVSLQREVVETMPEEAEREFDHFLQSHRRHSFLLRRGLRALALRRRRDDDSGPESGSDDEDPGPSPGFFT